MSQQNLKQIKDLNGDAIKEIFVHAKDVAALHATLTSPRGNFFRKRLLQYLSGGLTQEEVEKLRQEFGVQETERHINRLLAYKLIESKEIHETAGYIRTPLGETAVNLIRELERKALGERAKKIFHAALGENSIQFFLKVYGSPKKPTGGDIIFTPLEIGQISRSLSLHRYIEGIAAIDKLDDAGLVSYLKDGNIHLNPKRSTAFYYYLKGLHSILKDLK